jgi:hypothetical protein
MNSPLQLHEVRLRGLHRGLSRGGTKIVAVQDDGACVDECRRVSREP